MQTDSAAPHESPPGSLNGGVNGVNGTDFAVLAGGDLDSDPIIVVTLDLVNGTTVYETQTITVTHGSGATGYPIQGVGPPPNGPAPTTVIIVSVVCAVVMLIVGVVVGAFCSRRLCGRRGTSRSGRKGRRIDSGDEESFRPPVPSVAPTEEMREVGGGAGAGAAIQGFKTAFDGPAKKSADGWSTGSGGVSLSSPSRSKSSSHRSDPDADPFATAIQLPSTPCTPLPPLEPSAPALDDEDDGDVKRHKDAGHVAGERRKSRMGKVLEEPEVGGMVMMTQRTRSVVTVRSGSVGPPGVGARTDAVGRKVSLPPSYSEAINDERGGIRVEPTAPPLEMAESVVGAQEWSATATPAWSREEE
ncbi:hypothetical protein HK101_005568 [Irineochytrium annulatum]|nr:hypothetical protein HK101_005568 [Irineochytrium annulatum]